MRYPAIDDLMEKVDNKYSLILVVAKRAREIIDGANPKLEFKNNNPVSIATQEVYEGLIKFEYKDKSPYEAENSSTEL